MLTPEISKADPNLTRGDAAATNLGGNMGQPGAKRGDRVVGVDTHIVMIPSASGAVPTPVSMPYSGQLSAGLSAVVRIDEEPAATKGSKAMQSAPHVPSGGPFQRPPSNEARVDEGSATVLIDDKPAARAGDVAITCNDPDDAPRGRVVASGTVVIG
jgi:uncharacterized Zn-binding protein involved in type VI secretion